MTLIEDARDRAIQLRAQARLLRGQVDELHWYPFSACGEFARCLYADEPPRKSRGFLARYRALCLEAVASAGGMRTHPPFFWTIAPADTGTPTIWSRIYFRIY
jgi:hypothetical protein